MFILLICIGFPPFRKTYANLRMVEKAIKKEEREKGREIFGFSTRYPYANAFKSKRTLMVFWSLVNTI